MKTGYKILPIIATGIIVLFAMNNGHDLFHYMDLPYEWHDSFGFTDRNLIRSTQCASEELGWLEPCIDVKVVSDDSPEQLEAILKYCIDSKDLVDTVGLAYHNNTHYIDTVTCEWQKYSGVQIDSEGLDSGWITIEAMEPVWVLIPVTSCSYPWHESNHEKSKQYSVEYRNIFGDYNPADPHESAEAMHYVITRYYEDLGKDILDVKTMVDHSVPVTGEGCHTTVGAIWHLKIQNADLAYFLDKGYVERELENED